MLVAVYFEAVFVVVVVSLSGDGDVVVVVTTVFTVIMDALQICPVAQLLICDGRDSPMNKEFLTWKIDKIICPIINY